MPNLSSFRRTNTRYFIRLRQDEHYWDAVRLLQKAFKSEAVYLQGPDEFSLPNNHRTRLKMAKIFPLHWRIIQDTNPLQINFPAESPNADAP